MGMNVNRWIKYAKARIDASVRSGNEELDRREADLVAERTDRPWLASDGDAPTFEEAQARIRWEAEAAERAEKAKKAKTDGDPAPAPAASHREPSPSDVDPLSGATTAEHATARLELDERARASAERLDDIRRELGVASPTDDGPHESAPPNSGEQT